MPFKQAMERILSWIGPFGLTVIVAITVVGWLYYDLSAAHTRLTLQEAAGLFVFSVLVVAVVKSLYALVCTVTGNRCPPADE